MERLSKLGKEEAVDKNSTLLQNTEIVSHKLLTDLNLNHDLFSLTVIQCYIWILKPWIGCISGCEMMFWSGFAAGWDSADKLPVTGVCSIQNRKQMFLQNSIVPIAVPLFAIHCTVLCCSGMGVFPAYRRCRSGLLSVLLSALKPCLFCCLNPFKTVVIYQENMEISLAEGQKHLPPYFIVLSWLSSELLVPVLELIKLKVKHLNWPCDTRKVRLREGLHTS